MSEEKNKSSRGLLTIILLTMLMVFSILLLDGMSNKQKSGFSELLQDINNGTVVSVMIQGQEIEYKTSENGKPVKVIGPKESDYLLQILAEKEIMNESNNLEPLIDRAEENVQQDMSTTILGSKEGQLSLSEWEVE